MKINQRWVFAVCLLVLGTQSSWAGVCRSGSGADQLCSRMRHLRAQIFALDSQRELMQINSSYMYAMGLSISDNANMILPLLGLGIPEHHMGISGAARLGKELSNQAYRNDGDMVVTANQIREQCITCHAQERPPGGVKWDEIFRKDWTYISIQCAQPGRNPYLCKSMNGMLSAYGYLFTAQDASVQDFSMTEQAAMEIARILADLKSKNFSHLPEEYRQKAEGDARELASLAAAKNPAAFERIKTVANACMECHKARSVGTRPSPMDWRLDMKSRQTWIEQLH